jgi:hypothetical protein
VVLGLCTLTGALVFVPRPIVSPPSTPFAQGNPLAVSFDVSNGGFIPLDDVGVSVGVGQIVSSHSRMDQNLIPNFNSRISNPDWQHHTLGMDGRFTVGLESMFAGGWGSADLAIVVSYKPWMLPFRREKLFRFVTFGSSDGNVYWRSWPLGERQPQF